ncbi:trans-aconitate 2-methyltransferase [Sphingomonas sp. SUN039]|uniref:class I SAM-dependent methyltransferase n=1 Tax=Sphingomonas sp. SUN039 TaxID=2937787 RepID=UPI00216478EC|nr:class I SAM-dependent methyltransferase [Sphingomonas sp. SUN039]UVO53263.1 class I SAM-dependent methyltransferase [Sphingomonas sp. SUN039]
MTSVENLAGEEWRGRVGGSWAAEWVRTDRSFAELTGHLVEAVSSTLPPLALTTRRSVLDIGCGAGETALRLASERPDLDVTGLDLSDELVAAARERGAGQSNLSYATGDASNWQGAALFDAALSRHGVMFFDDPVAAFTHLRSLMAPHAPLAFTCFAARADNFWASELAELIGAPLPVDPYAPGPFAFAEADRVHAILDASGWQNATSERIDYRYVAGGGDDPVGDALDFFMRIGPAARHIATLDVAARQALEPRLKTWLQGHIEGGEVRFPASAWLWRATA